MSTQLKTSQKIVLWLISEGKTRIWLAKELGITRQTLAQRMKDKFRKDRLDLSKRRFTLIKEFMTKRFGPLK